MSFPRVSVVTISYNQVSFLEKAILSVLSQSYPNIEYIIVDPGSKDGSRDIIDRYSSRLAKVIYQKDDGPADGLNIGLTHCTGEFFCYLNSDDFFLEGAIDKAIRHMRTNPELAFVTGDGLIVNELDQPIKRFISAPFNLWRYAYGHSIVCQQSTFFRRSCIVDVGGFNAANHIAWDAELIINIAKRGGKSKLIHEYWSAFRMHSESITCNPALGKKHKLSHEGFFHSIMGRDIRWYDRLLKYPARLTRWFVDPKGLWERLRPLNDKVL